MTDDAARNGHCVNTRARIHPYLTDRLESDEHARYAAHLVDCADCRGYVEFMDDAIHLTCQDVVELITDYLEGALPPAERARFEAHLALCKGCNAYLAQMRETIQLTGKLAPEDVAPEVKRDLLAAFRTWKQPD